MPTPSNNCSNGQTRLGRIGRVSRAALAGLSPLDTHSDMHSRSDSGVSMPRLTLWMPHSYRARTPNQELETDVIEPPKAYTAVVDENHVEHIFLENVA
jgi:hypothetical protein